MSHTEHLHQFYARFRQYVAVNETFIERFSNLSEDVKRMAAGDDIDAFMWLEDRYNDDIRRLFGEWTKDNE
jgi:hypothetical protein